MGIVYPDVNNAAQARKAVDICKFSPIGKRSVTGGYPHFDYKSVPLTTSVVLSRTRPSPTMTRAPS